MDARKKRLKLRAWRRGTRELDLIFGTVVDRLLPEMTDAQMDQIETLLGEPDMEVYAWITGSSPVPPEFDHEMFRELQDFAKVAAEVQKGELG